MCVFVEKHKFMVHLLNSGVSVRPIVKKIKSSTVQWSVQMFYNNDYNAHFVTVTITIAISMHEEFQTFFDIIGRKQK